MQLFRFADSDGEILKVRVLAGFKVLVALDDPDDLVLLQLWRRVRLVGLPAAVKAGYADNRRHLNAYFGPLPDRKDCGFGFTSGDLRVHLQDLPAGQVVDVLPEPQMSTSGPALSRPIASYSSVHELVAVGH